MNNFEKFCKVVIGLCLQNCYRYELKLKMSFVQTDTNTDTTHKTVYQFALFLYVFGGGHLAYLQYKTCLKVL
jgi:hypothetical protein